MQTTHAERTTAAILTADLIETADQARRMIGRLYTRYFADYEQRSIEETEAEEIGDTLDAIHSLLFYAIRDTRLDLGDGTQTDNEATEQRDRKRRISELNAQAWKIEKTLTGAEREAWDAARTEAADAPDADALKALERLINSRSQ